MTDAERFARENAGKGVRTKQGKVGVVVGHLGGLVVLDVDEGEPYGQFGTVTFTHACGLRRQWRAWASDLTLLDRPLPKLTAPPATSAAHHEQLRKAAGVALGFLSGLRLDDQPVAVQRECLTVVRGLMEAIDPKRYRAEENAWIAQVNADAAKKCSSSRQGAQ